MSSPSDNVIQGRAWLFTAAPDAAIPTAADVDDLIAGNMSGWELAGRTEDGVTLSSTPEQEAVTFDETLHAVDHYITDAETTISAEVKEATAERLAAWLRGEENAGTITHGQLGAAPKVKVAFVGQWITGDRVLMVAPRCVYNGETELNFQAGEANTTGIEFAVLDAGDEKENGSDFWMKLADQGTGE